MRCLEKKACFACKARFSEAPASKQGFEKARQNKVLPVLLAKAQLCLQRIL